MSSARLNVVFSHGQESGPWGTKISHLAGAVREWGGEALSVDYQGIDSPQERVKMLIEYCRAIEGPIVLAGSSMGGHVASTAALVIRPAGVFVLAPAFYMPGFEKLTPIPPSCPMTIVHGWHDDVVPLSNVLKFARDAQCATHILDGDHRLSECIDTISLLLIDFLNQVVTS